MIRSESEYKRAVTRLREEAKHISDHRESLAKEGYTAEQIKRAVDPLLSFHLQLQDEVESYDRLRRGDLGELSNLHGFGLRLIGLRIALGLSQREFANKLGVSDSQVCRDERNEYHGLRVERASQILDALGVVMRSKFNEPIVRKRPIAEEEEEYATA
jgi:hypothetical protein